MRVRSAWLALSVLLGSAPLVGAQDSAATAAVRSHPVEQRAWLSIAAGPGFIHTASSGGALSGAIAAVYSPGIMVFEARTSGATEIFGDGVGDQSLLVGLRTSGRRTFLLGAIGYGRSQYSHSCDGPCSANFTDPYRSAITYEGTAEANARVIGIGATVFGVIGEGRASYTTMALSLQLGWLGR